jgi:DNA repair exonuclease SbcCD ATPase subunit
MLCHECGLHNTPIARRELKPDELRACENTPAVTRFIHGKSVVSIRRRYGVTGSQFEMLRTAGIYSSQHIDENQKSELERSISQLEAELKEIKEELSSKKADYDGLRIQIAEIRDDQKKITDRKTQKQQQLSDFANLKAQSNSLREKLEEKTQGGTEYCGRIEQLEKKLNKLAMKRATIAQGVEVCDLRTSFCV